MAAHANYVGTILTTWIGKLNMTFWNSLGMLTLGSCGAGNYDTSSY